MTDSVAITGLALRVPGASDATAFFANLCANVDSISRFERHQQLEKGVPRRLLEDPRYVAAGGVLEDIDQFDAGLFGLSRREAELADPQQRIFLEIVWEALEDAGINPFAPGLVAGLFAGCSLSRYLLLHAAPHTDPIGSVENLLALAGNDKDHIATRTAYLLDFRGPSVNVQSSCSTSLVAVHLACQSLLNRECDAAVAGAASIQLPQGYGYLHEPGGITSPDGYCRPFDASASGTVFSSGAGAVVLKRAEDAVAAGDRIYALIRGSAIYNDGGRKVGYTAPGHEGQVRTVATALAVAGVEPSSIRYVECHGTGTALGDPVEIGALAEAFGTDLPPGSCAIGSVKGNVGHLECASGIAGLIKMAMALANGVVPASLHFERPNPRIDFAATPFQVLAQRMEWPRGEVRRACVHSLGMGGTNAHVVLEEAPLARPATVGRQRVLLLSAAGDAALRELAQRYEAFLEDLEPGLWPQMCAASVSRRARLRQALTFEADSLAEGLAKLRQWRERGGVVGPVSAVSEEPAPWISLPSYPFQRERYWTDAGPWLPGERRRNPKIRADVFETTLSVNHPEWVRGHKVQGVVTLPGAAFLEMAQSAAGPECCIADAEFLHMLRLSSDPLLVQTHIDSEGNSWEIHALEGDDWRLAARGGLEPVSVHDEPMPAVPPLTGDPAALYRRAAEAGVEYSGAFRAIRGLAVEDGGAWAQIQVPYACQSALIDACWQVAGSMLPAGQTWVPAAMERCTVLHSGIMKGYCYATVSRIQFWSEDGELALLVEGLHFRPLSGWLMEPVWEPQPRTLADIAESLRERDLRLERFAQVRERTEEATALFCRRFFEQARGYSANGHTRLLARMAALAAGRPPSDQDPSTFCRQQAEEFPELAAQWNFIERCGSALPAVFRGEVDPLTLLFSGGGMDAIYETSPFSQLLNSLLAEAVRACSASGAIRTVIEIGAGTGASTRAVLPILDEAEYWFTDISPAFVEQARAAFPTMRHATLDISLDPASQGFEPAGFDLALAAHVLHATPDLRRTLRHVRSLLRPGGRLLLLETVEQQAWLDITFGLTPGWWNSTDDDLRHGYPLLHLDAWLELLREEGFRAEAVVAGEGTALLLAELPTSEAPVVYSRALDSRQESPPEAARILCRGLREILESIGSAPLWVITRDAETDPAAAALWGLMQSARQEFPALRATCLDISGSTTWAQVEAELAAGVSTENRVSLRDGRRYVQRLRPLAHHAWPTPHDKPVPGPGEVAIDVTAAGVNFRDLLRASGAYTGGEGPPGSECSGTITAVGRDVHGIAVGDPVIAAAEGSFSSQVVAKAALVAPKSHSMPWETAAGIPIAWMTAAYALETVGRIRRGETVLIHAASGGVGLAACELARQAGATVIATAGSEEKREFLRRQGIEQVFDSRTASFRQARVDLVLNCLSGPLIPASFDTLKLGGRFLEIGRLGIWTEEEAHAYRPDVSYSVIGLDEEIRRDPERMGEMLRSLIPRVVDTGLQQVFAPWQLEDAFRLMRQAKHIGKITLRMPRKRFEARPDATYLITGGTRGLGLHTAKWLIERGARNLVLVGKHGTPAPALKGANAVVKAVDTADATAVQSLVEWIDTTMPPLAGVVHAAGVLRDHPLSAFPDAAFDETLATKAAGAWALHQSTRNRPLDFFVCYSSVGSLLGSAGQSNHTAANAFLDALCHHRRARGNVALTINWSAWSEIGAASSPELAARLASLGLDRIRPAEGLAALETALLQGVPQAVALPADWKAYFQHEPNPPRILEGLRPHREQKNEPKPTAPPQNLQQQLAAMPSRDRERAAIQAVRQEAARILGTPSRLPAPDEPLGDLGIDSLMAIELRGCLASVSGLSLPVTLLFNYPTAASLGAYLLSRMSFPDREEEMARLLAMELGVT